ncbi:MAG: tetratricopeptide repeat protein [FCB group bacterium]|nr:tetratricopeptide repeat protein [FCB group bacterium]
MKRRLVFVPILLLTFVWIGCASEELTSAKLYIQQENWEKAEEFLVKALDAEPNNPEIPYMLGDLIYGKRGDWDKMSEMFDRAMSLDPEKPILQGAPVKEYVSNSRQKYWVKQYNAGVKYFNDYRNADGDAKEEFLTKAIGVLNDAVKIDPDEGKSFTLLATCYYQAGDQENARKIAVEGVDRMPEDVQANLTAGQILNNIDDKEGSIPYFRKAIELDPANSSAIRSLAQVYYDLNDVENSIETYEKAIAKESDRKIKADLYFNLGVLYMKVEDFTSAEDNFNLAYDMNPDDVEALVGMAQTFEGAGKWSRAAKYYKELIFIDPDNPNHYKGMARVLLKQGKAEEATHYYQKGKALE